MFKRPHQLRPSEKDKKNIKSVQKKTFSREEAERLAAEERERAKRERRCPECGNKVFPFFPGIF